MVLPFAARPISGANHPPEPYQDPCKRGLPKGPDRLWERAVGPWIRHACQSGGPRDFFGVVGAAAVSNAGLADVRWQGDMERDGPSPTYSRLKGFHKSKIMRSASAFSEEVRLITVLLESHTPISALWQLPYWIRQRRQQSTALVDYLEAQRGPKHTK
ncbi:hypothetical protein SUNI508_11906 [Seiridium unicorne]|uniref:Uncharacterized protein n=1 Tax=Seiridium unicorne TaxID=138068 RepID=A0ABR2UFU0_9PEZI